MALFLAGCTVPLGPGFAHPSRESSVAEMAGSQNTAPRIHIKIHDELQNIGNRTLSYLDIRVPATIPTNMAGLTVRVNDREAAVARLTQDAASPARLKFPTPWERNQTRAVDFEYDLQSGTSDRGLIAAVPDAFHICDPAGFPSWVPPVGPFVKADLHAQVATLETTVPQAFRVLASGQEQAALQQGSASIRRFRRTPDEFPPYIVAGRYQERVISTPQAPVLFWSLQPIRSEEADLAARRLAATAATFYQMFGSPAFDRRQNRKQTFAQLRVVETPAILPAVDETAIAESGGFSATSFPEGVLLDSRAFVQGIATEPVLRLAEYELARTWFGWRVGLSQDAEVLLGHGMGIFAVMMAAEARERGDSRRQEIARVIAAYDRARTSHSEVPSTGEAETSEAAYRSALFLVALQDIAGPEKFYDALRRIVRVMAGEEVGYPELRSSLETASGRNLETVFRTWRSGGDIPADFRSRYDRSTASRLLR